MDQKHKTFDEELRLADYKARCWVQGTGPQKYRDGTRRIGPVLGGFDTKFHQYQAVRDAVTEGWDRELRGYIVPLVRKHVLGGGDPNALSINDLLPPQQWIDYARDQARRSCEAAEWREKVIAEHGSMDAYLTKTVSRRTNAAQPVAGAANRVIAQLTERSKAMAGENA